MKLQLTAQLDFFETLIVWPTDGDVRRAYAEFINRQIIPARVHYGVLILEKHEAHEYIREAIPKELHERVYDGWPTEFESDTWDFGVRLGFEACWLFQGGKAQIDESNVITSEGFAYRLEGYPNASSV